MEQHQVPQHIASYEFHLIGDMTLKQFFQVAAGGLVGLAFYGSPLPGIIKWPAILFSGIFGVALAFLPLEERPLSTWIILFLRSIYSPTVYKRPPLQGSGQDVFATEAGVPKLAQIAATPHGEEAAKKYLETPGMDFESRGVISTFEEEEGSFLSKILSVFHQVPVVPTTPPHAPRPQIVVEEHTVEKEEPTVQIPKIATPEFPAQQMFVPSQQEQPAAQVAVAAPFGQISPISPSGPTLSQTLPTSARFSPSARPPLAPQTPNVAIGQIVDEKGNGIEAAILEIRDGSGRPVRALRSNKVGHFLTVTPLTPGAYQIIVEKEGWEFSPVMFSVIDTIIPPIEIMGRKVAMAT